jgi:hypothetical protein
MTVRKSRKPAWNRSRSHPIQVYLTAAELAAVRKIAAKRAIKLSDLVRGWIRRATAAARERPKARAEDPRQLRLE